ncbi:unnamed protein product, partial [Meganyctiphanes norvegica]
KVEDETDRASVKSGGSKSRASSAPPVRRSVLGAALPPKSAGTSAGAVDEASFFASFEDVPKVNIYSARELDNTMNGIREIIGNPNNDWDKRVEALKKIRGVLIAGGSSYEEFYPHLRLLEPAINSSIKDLRSQVVREVCITVAYMSQELHHKVDHMCEMILPSLISLIQCTAKVMASAGIVAIRFIIQNTHHHKLVPIIVRELSTSKSKEIRKSLCEVLDQLVHTWPTHAMEKHTGIMSEAIKKAMADADSEARASARKAYWGYCDHFKDEADKLLNSLDPSYKKALQGEAGMSNSSSSQSLQGSTIKSTVGSRSGGWSRSSSTAGSTENLSGSFTSRLPLSGGVRRSAIPTPRSYDTPDSPATPSTPTNFRSNSAIDLQAARRAQAREKYANAQRLKIGSGASL